MDVTDARGPSETGVQIPEGSSAAFDPGFFTTVFADRLKAACEGHPPETPVVLLDLVDGSTLDLCHIEGLAPRWLLVAAFRGEPTCERMDLVFVPYESILRVTVSSRDAQAPAMGFSLAKSLPALSTAEGTQT
jgi:hypothetical protein